MRLYIIENTQRLSWVEKILSRTITSSDKRLNVANVLIDIDPTSDKKLSQWLARLVNNGIISIRGQIAANSNTQIRLPEDAERVNNVLRTFEKSKPRMPVESRDINNYADFNSIEDILDKVVNTGRISPGTANIIRRVPGADVIYNKQPYVLYMIKKITKGSENDQDSIRTKVQRVDAVRTLGMGPPETKWCTRAAYHSRSEIALRYLKSGDIYILYKDGIPFIQKCKSQVMDVNDRRTELPAEIVGHIAEREERIRIVRLAEAAKKWSNKEELYQRLGGRKAVLTIRGTEIIADTIVDSGRDYYYIGINKSQSLLANPKSGKKLLLLKNNGLGDNRAVGRLFRFVWNYETILTISKKNVVDMVA